MVNVHTLKMKFFVVGSILIAYFVHDLIANQRGCSFVAHGPKEKFAPLMVQNETIIMPKNGRIFLKSKESITLLCPDPRNLLIRTNRNLTEAQCIGGKVLRLVREDFNFEELTCKYIIKGSVLKTSKKCANNEGRIYKIGYPLSPRFFLTLVEVCYDPAKGSTFYTEHLLHGQDIKHSSNSNYRPPFSNEAATDAVSIAYRRAFQKATFNKLLKSTLEAQKYINEFSQLSRGHLSPDADFLFAATQYTTYYYINAAPQWQAMNAGNWRRIEGMVRKVADHLGETLTIYTGTHDVLALPDVQGQPQKMFLISGDKLPVPKFFWKIVYSKKNQQAVVLIALNNPFVNETRSDYILCNDVCRESGWNSPSWGDYSRGLAYCCDYNQFAFRVETAPKILVGGLLQGPQKFNKQIF